MGEHRAGFFVSTTASGAVVGQVQRGAAVGRAHHRLEASRDAAGIPYGPAQWREAVGDEAEALGSQVVGVRGSVVHALLDRGAPRTAGLDLQEGQSRIQVGAGADLEAATALVSGLEVGAEFGGVEVGRGVGEAAPTVDVEDEGPLGQGVDDALCGVGGDEVLAVDAGEQAGGGVEVLQGRGGQALGVEGGGGGRGRGHGWLLSDIQW